jgi:hypothetical protein
MKVELDGHSDENSGVLRMDSGASARGTTLYPKLLKNFAALVVRSRFAARLVA